MNAAGIAIENIHLLQSLNDFTILVAQEQLKKQRLEQFSSPIDQAMNYNLNTPAPQNPWYNGDNNLSNQNARDSNQLPNR